MAIKAQALADFMAKFTHKTALEINVTLPKEAPTKQNSDEDLAKWKLFVDESSNQHGCGAGLVLQTPSSEQIEYAIRLGFRATNNEAGYEALLTVLRVATKLGVDSLEAFSDFQLVVNQVQGDYLAKDTRMVAYVDEVKTISRKIEFLANPSIEVAKSICQANASSTWMDDIIAYLQIDALPLYKFQARQI
ncbi:hypothetical protein Acr_27g0002310 [Actinidia rufa]|uniref:RNase H type-1 domain-containing protein n=1 Tax=Actinidia rufa TaxID=165716 RepID=A0A7J0H5Y7_9ERIC|nr:hypothetical protein Acr_27g0002310 [Actinidia rufa]